MDLKSVVILIEKLRTDINKSCENSALIDDAVVQKSQKLDALLNQYDRFTKDKQKKPESYFRSDRW